MANSIFDPSFEDLPRDLPIFPLPSVLLLPRGKLPLNLFEPRYLAMGLDAIAGNRMIGMIQPVVPERDPVGDTAGVYRTGCAGRITSFSETTDGRLLITLTGICRFDVVREIAGDRQYRRVEPDFSPYRADLEQPAQGTPIDRERLVSALRAYTGATGMDFDWGAVEDAGDELLVMSLAMVCPFEAQEKQALLEAADLTELANTVITLMEMAIRGSGSGTLRH